ncbi:4606_t:CDS:2, partial [Scutellospora calospora]
KKAVYAHIRAVHQNERRFNCYVPGCGMSFAYKKVMDNHVKNIHEHPRVRKVRKLNKDDKINRDVTEIEHLTGFGYYNSGRNISCMVEGCEFMFKRQYDLSRHMKSQHPD